MIRPLPIEDEKETEAQKGVGTDTGDAGEASMKSLVGELFGAVENYVDVRRDRLRVDVQAFAVKAAAAIAGAALAVATAVTAVVLFFVGVAGGIGAALGDRWWLGSLLTGSGIIAIAAASAWLGSQTLRRRQIRSLETKYEPRHRKNGSAE
jgi:hypothetical protein